MAITRKNTQSEHGLNIPDDYRGMVEGALRDMGYRPEADGVPALEQVQAGIAAVDGLSAWLLARAEQGAKDQLVISRTVGGEHGIGVAQTIHRLDPNAHADGYVWGSLWGDAKGKNNPYGDKATVHDQTGPDITWDTAILLGDTTDPATGDQAYDPGLAYTNKTVPAQREAFAEEAAKLLKERGITIVTAKLGAMVTDYAGIRSKGGQQRAGFTRLIDYPKQTVKGGAGRVACVPNVSGYGRPSFHAAGAGGAWYDVGARRLVRVSTHLDV